MIGMIETHQIKTVIFLQIILSLLLSKKNNKFLFTVNESGTCLSLDFNVRINLMLSKDL